MTLPPDMRAWSLEAVDFYTERLAHRIVEGHEVPARAELAAVEDTRRWFEVHAQKLRAMWAQETA